MREVIVESARLGRYAQPPRRCATDAGPAEPPRCTSSDALLQGARRLLIEHAGEVYTLHLTRQNKLLLTK
jgi:hemin uptake protein HemP